MPSDSLASRHILIIDDDAEILDLIKVFLTLEKCEVDTASTGMECLEKVKANDYDLLLLDIGLPDISGQQICKLVRQDSGVPIIMVSANDSVSDKVICLEYGADDYISKPFENMELIARVKAVLRRVDANKKAASLARNEDVDFYGIAINLAERQVSKDGETLKLTPKEFDLLAYFSQNRGKTIGRDKIIEDLWGKNTLYRWSRSLDVHIQNLRQKVEKNPKSPSIIQTVSGVGYKIK